MTSVNIGGGGEECDGVILASLKPTSFWEVMWQLVSLCMYEELQIGTNTRNKT